jgi:hypothetical protein
MTSCCNVVAYVPGLVVLAITVDVRELRLRSRVALGQSIQASGLVRLSSMTPFKGALLTAARTGQPS